MSVQLRIADIVYIFTRKMVPISELIAEIIFECTIRGFSTMDEETERA